MWRESYIVRQPKILETLALMRLAEWIALQEERFKTPACWQYLSETQSGADKQLLSRKLHKFWNYLEHKMPIMLTPEQRQRRNEWDRAKHLLSQQIANIRHYLEHKLPDKYNDMLLIEVTNRIFGLYYPSKRNKVGQSMETLLTKNLNSLRIKSSCYKHNYENYFSKAHMLTGLTQLEFEGFRQGKNTIQLLKELHGLKHLSLSVFCTDTVLKCIAENCKLIEAIDLSGSIVTVSIKILTQLRNLKSVTLPNTVSVRDTATLLIACEKIEMCSYLFIENVFEHIASSEENSEKQFKLKSYDSEQFANYYDRTTLDKVLLVFKMCPRLEKVKLAELPYRSRILQALRDLKHLRDLTLYGYYFYSDRVKELLEFRGCDLVHLILENAYDIDLNAVKYITVTCPNLQSLTIDIIRRGYTNPYRQQMFVNDTKEFSPLIHLKGIVLRGYKGARFTGEQLIFLLSNCANVEYIECETDSLTDDVMLAVLDQTPKKLMYLREMKTSHDFSTLLIDRIVQNCINHPVIIVISRADVGCVFYPPAPLPTPRF